MCFGGKVSYYYQNAIYLNIYKTKATGVGGKLRLYPLFEYYGLIVAYYKYFIRLLTGVRSGVRPRT